MNQTQFSQPHATAFQPIKPPTGVKVLGWYYLIGAIPFILLSFLFFTIPIEELTNHPQYIERDRAFLNAVRYLIFGGLLLYSTCYLIGAVGLLKGKRWGYFFALILSVIGAIHLNPFVIPGLIVCLGKKARAYFNID